MCRTLYVAKTANIGYTTSMGAEEIRVPSRGMRQMDVHMVRCVMSRYIDADALTKEIKQDIADNGLTERYVFYRINDAPSIDIVRCKECKHWHDHITTSWCSRGAELRPQESGWIKRNADDFCSYGERREP